MTKNIKGQWWWIVLLYLEMILFFTLFYSSIKPWVSSFGINYAPPAPSISSDDIFIYWQYAQFELGQIPLNLLGPSLAIKLFQSFDLIVLFNLSMLLYAIKECSVYCELRVFKFAGLLFLNPMIMFQFLVPSKEVGMIISLILLMTFCRSKKLAHLITAIGLAIFSKVEFLGIVLLFSFLIHLDRKNRLVLFSFLIFLITFLYSEIPGMQTRAMAMIHNQSESSSGIFVILHKLSLDYYFYPATIIPKFLINIAEGFISFFQAQNAINFYIFFSAVCFCLVFLIGLTNFGVDLTDDFIVMILLFAIMVSVVPFPHHRYILPVYTLFAIKASFFKFSNNWNTQR